MWPRFTSRPACRGECFRYVTSISRHVTSCARFSRGQECAYRSTHSLARLKCEHKTQRKRGATNKQFGLDTTTAQLNSTQGRDSQARPSPGGMEWWRPAAARAAAVCRSSLVPPSRTARPRPPSPSHGRPAGSSRRAAKPVMTRHLPKSKAA